MLAFAQAHALPIPRLDTPVDVNLWERCTRESLAAAAAPAIDRTPDSAATVVLELSRGTPDGLNGVTMPLFEISAAWKPSPARTASAGRSSSRGRWPAVRTGSSRSAVRRRRRAARFALRQAQRLVCRRTRCVMRSGLSARYRTSSRAAPGPRPHAQGCDAFVDAVQARITGTVRVRLLEGSISVMDCVARAMSTRTSVNRSHR